MDRTKGLWRYPFTRAVVLTLFLAVSLLGLVILPYLGTTASAHAATGTICHLNSARGNIQHVIYIQFDNTHFTRDNPNVPSDLEQMPHLLNFIEGNGVLLSNHHTPLIAHTATDILTSITGVYGDRHGVPVSTTFQYFKPDGTTNTGVSYAYWTAPIFTPPPTIATDTTFNMLSESGKNAPAPWVPYTRAGCNFGAVGTANTVLENTGVDIPSVFGANSPEAQEVKNKPAQAFADFVGIGVHCARGDALCSAANKSRPDLLPGEPGGYSEYMGLFGHKYVAPQISPSGPLTDLNGNVIKDPNGNIGFPGFDGMSAAVSLSYVAAMQEHGVPVTYAYIADAHDAHPNGPAFGPGSAGYVAALKAYDNAFGKFFTRLASDGIDQSNTLFVFTSDEGDHFVGGPPSPMGCNGVTTPCTYSQIGEINTNLAGLLATEQGITTPFKVHSDSSPTVSIIGNPARTDPVTRAFERGVGNLTAVNPLTRNTDTITKYLADLVEMKLLHMITADPARTPTFTIFADPNYFLFAGAPNCTSSPCVTEPPASAWNHGDVSPDINTTWLGLVGPGVRNNKVEDDVWSDHTDIRPTMMSLLGLKDDYAHDGRVLFEVLQFWTVPESLKAHRDTLTDLAQTYKQINACVGKLSLATLHISTKALESNAPGDSTYIKLENKLATITGQRNAIASQMIALLESAEFNNQPIDVRQAKHLIDQAKQLLESVN